MATRNQRAESEDRKSRARKNLYATPFEKNAKTVGDVIAALWNRESVYGISTSATLKVSADMVLLLPGTMGWKIKRDPRGIQFEVEQVVVQAGEEQPELIRVHRAPGGPSFQCRCDEIYVRSHAALERIRALGLPCHDGVIPKFDLIGVTAANEKILLAATQIGVKGSQVDVKA